MQLLNYHLRGIALNLNNKLSIKSFYEPIIKAEYTMNQGIQD